MARKESHLFDNLVLKVIALGLAVLLELFFLSPENAITITIPYRVAVRNIPERMMITEPRRALHSLVAQVKLRGPAVLVEKVKSSRSEFTIDLATMTRNRQQIFLDREQLKLPPPVEILDILPASYTFVLEERVSKEVPVVASTVGRPMRGYRLEGLGIEPARVFIEGPKSEIERIGELATKEIDLSSLAGPATLDVGLREVGELSRSDLSFVKVSFDVRAIEAFRTFKRISVTVRAPHGFAATVAPSKVKVVLGGPREVLEGLREKEVLLVADGRDLGQGDHLVELKGELPQGVVVDETVPPKVNLTLVTTDG